MGRKQSTERLELTGAVVKLVAEAFRLVSELMR